MKDIDTLPFTGRLTIQQEKAMIQNIHPPAGTILEKEQLGAISGYVDSACSPEVPDKLEHNPAESNTEPPVLVEILAPQHGSGVDSGATVLLSASASKGPLDLSGRVHWRSNIDGLLGSGRAVGAELSDGQHTLSASILPPGGTKTTATIGINVGDVSGRRLAPIDPMCTPCQDC